MSNLIHKVVDQMAGKPNSQGEKVNPSSEPDIKKEPVSDANIDSPCSQDVGSDSMAHQS